MFLVMTYGQFLAYMGGYMIGSVGGIALVVYLLYRALLFLLPAIVLALIGVLIFCVSRNGVKSFFHSAGIFILMILATLVGSGVLVAGACALANFDHMVLAILVMIPAIIIFVIGVIWSFLMFFGSLYADDHDPDKKFTVWTLVVFCLYLLLTFLQEEEDIPFLTTGPFSTYDFGFLVFVALINILRKHNLSKSLLLSFIPVLGYFSMMLYYSVDVKEWWYPFTEIMQTCGIKAALFLVPGLVIGLINRKRI